MGNFRHKNHYFPALSTPLQVDIPYIAPEKLETLSAEYASTKDTELREMLVLQHQRLVRSIASRFAGSGESLEDLIQVGNIGLMNALDRYDPSQGTRFSTFATPTILGEIKRYFRDKTSTIKMPRALQELQQVTRRAVQALTICLGRGPTISEVASYLNISEEQVTTAMESGEAMRPLSLESQTTFSNSSGQVNLQDILGESDIDLLKFEKFGDLRNALSILNAREHEVIALRFFDELSQAKIAQKLNISQMHVSRLQRRALKRLRDILSEDIRLHPGRRTLRKKS